MFISSFHSWASSTRCEYTTKTLPGCLPPAHLTQASLLPGSDYKLVGWLPALASIIEPTRHWTECSRWTSQAPPTTQNIIPHMLRVLGGACKLKQASFFLLVSLPHLLKEKLISSLQILKITIIILENGCILDQPTLDIFILFYFFISWISFLFVACPNYLVFSCILSKCNLGSPKTAR